MNQSFLIKSLILSSIFMVTFAQCKGQEFNKTEVKILKKFDLLEEDQSFENTRALKNLKEIVRFERSRRASLAIGVSITSLSILPIVGGLALNVENGKWINDSIGNGLLLAGGISTAISIPFYLGARKMKKRRDQSIARLNGS